MEYSIEIRTGDVKAFLAGERNEEPEPEPEPEPAPVPKPEPKPNETTSSASSAPSGGGGSSSAPSQPAQPSYTVVSDPASYDISSESITVKISNNSKAEGGYGYAYRIERDVNEKWEVVPLEFDVNAIAAILPAGQTRTETFSLHQEQYDYQPGTYRIVLLDGLGGASAKFTLTGNATPTYSVTADPRNYPVTSDSITVKITNTSQVEGGYGYAYRIERSVSGKWETVPLDFAVPEIAAILPAGKTNTETFRLHQEQYDYQPGTYRIVLLDGLNGASAQFMLN